MLRKFVTDVFNKVGLSEDDSNQAAEVVVHSDYSGVESHGLARLQVYLMRLQLGVVNKKPQIKQKNVSGNLMSLDGDNGLGIVVAPRAADMCIEKAKENGIAAVAIKNSNHYGVGNYYGWKFAQSDLIGINMTSTTPFMAPFGGIERLLGTNPITIGIPAGKRHPIVLDMATSMVSFGQIQKALGDGKKIPLNWAIDKEGKETDSAFKALSGALSPIGGHKGYGLAVIVDMLAAILSQAAYGRHIGRLDDFANPTEEKIGHFMLAMDVSKFQPLEDFKTSVDDYIDMMKNSEKASGVKEIFMPGEIEFLKAKEREEKGIPIKSEMQSSLLRLATQHKLGSADDTMESLFDRYK